LPLGFSWQEEIIAANEMLTNISKYIRFNALTIMILFKVMVFI